MREDKIKIFDGPSQRTVFLPSQVYAPSHKCHINTRFWGSDIRLKKRRKVTYTTRYDIVTKLQQKSRLRHKPPAAWRDFWTEATVKSLFTTICSKTCKEHVHNLSYYVPYKVWCRSLHPQNQSSIDNTYWTNVQMVNLFWSSFPQKKDCCIQNQDFTYVRFRVAYSCRTQNLRMIIPSIEQLGCSHNCRVKYEFQGMVYKCWFGRFNYSRNEWNWTSTCNSCFHLLCPLKSIN